MRHVFRSLDLIAIVYCVLLTLLIFCVHGQESTLYHACS